jgi:hypothetical protein
MYKTTLVESDIADGQRVVDEAEKLLRVAAALWLYLEEEDEWKLVIVSPDVPEKGPFRLYTSLAAMLNNLSSDSQKPIQMPLARVTLLSPASLLYERVKRYSELFDAHVYKMG